MGFSDCAEEDVLEGIKKSIWAAKFALCDSLQKKSRQAEFELHYTELLSSLVRHQRYYLIIVLAKYFSYYTKKVYFYLLTSYIKINDVDSFHDLLSELIAEDIVKHDNKLLCYRDWYLFTSKLFEEASDPQLVNLSEFLQCILYVDEYVDNKTALQLFSHIEKSITDSYFRLELMLHVIFVKQQFLPNELLQKYRGIIGRIRNFGFFSKKHYKIAPVKDDQEQLKVEYSFQDFGPAVKKDQFENKSLFGRTLQVDYTFLSQIESIYDRLMILLLATHYDEALEFLETNDSFFDGSKKIEKIQYKLAIWFAQGKYLQVKTLLRWLKEMLPVDQYNILEGNFYDEKCTRGDS